MTVAMVAGLCVVATASAASANDYWAASAVCRSNNDESGMQTVILLLRRDPVPDDVDLDRLLDGLDKQPLQDPRSLVWFKNGIPVTQQVDRTRGPQFWDAEEINDPVYRTQRTIYKKLSPHFELVSAISFAYKKD